MDTDPGIDDAHALCMALAHPDACIVMVTTVAGNVDVDQCTTNASWILGTLKATAQLHRGAARALLAERIDARHVHGPDGLAGVTRTAVRQPVASEHAVLALLRLARQASDELTLVAMGPLTNLALAVRLDPRFAEAVGRLVLMCGSIAARGNATAVAEFNAAADPEAAAIVLTEFPRTTLVSWDTTVSLPLTRSELWDLFSGDSAAARMLGAIERSREQHDPAHRWRETVYRADPLAMAVALEPDIVTRSERHAVRVQLGPDVGRGQTVVDWRDEWTELPQAEIVLEVDRDRFRHLMRV